MIDGVPPALALFGAAVLLPVMPLLVRRVLCVLAPLLGLVFMYQLPAGESWPVSFLGYPLLLARTDALSLIFGLVFLVSAVLANLYGWHRTRRTEQVASLIYIAGGLAVVFAGDLISMLIGWEIMAVASTLLIFARRQRRSLRAGQRYLMVHLTAGAVLLLGVCLIVAGGESITFGRLVGLGPGAWLILIALCVNAAVPPVHAWLPDAYPEASVAGSVFLSAFTTKAAVYCLVRAFAGSELLVWAGAIMALYGVLFAVMENNLRRLLGYHIVSQVGYMVCGVGIGTAMALNGAVGHAFCHILYKGLLYMGAGAVLYTTGREKLSDLGGLVRQMPLTLGLSMVGALSISGAPLFNGFISKSLVVAGAAEDGRGLIVWLLSLASVGTFLSVGLKLPYFAWFGTRREGHAHEAPLHMLLAMGITAALCVLLGVAPGWLYARLPFPPVDYHPYTSYHVFETLLLMTFTAIAFWQLRSRLTPHASITLDTDWLYRRPAVWVVQGFAVPLDKATARIGAHIAHLRDRIVACSRNPTLALARWRAAKLGMTSEAEASQAQPRTEPLPWFDEDRQRPALAAPLLWVLTIFAALAFLLVLAE